MKRHSLAAAAIASIAFLPACNDDGNDDPIEWPMPTFFQMHATAEAQEGDLTVNCSIGFVVEITGEVSRTRDVVEYIAIMARLARLSVGWTFDRLALLGRAAFL